MKSEVWVGKKGYRYYYYRFRDSEYYSLVVIGFTLLICFVLIFNIIVPEVTHWFSIRDEVIATRQRISILQQNINFINNQDKGVLNTQLQTVSHALPPEKNFSYMLNAISNSAATSGVSLNDYAFQVGNVTTGQSNAGDVQRKGLSTIEITVVVNGSVDSVRRFIQSLNKNLPLSEVTSVNGTGENVAVRLQFYQKPFANVNFTGETPLTGLPAKKEELLQTISNWDNTSEQNLSAQSGSRSAVPLF
jgi:hypothetical protein